MDCGPGHAHAASYARVVNAYQGALNLTNSTVTGGTDSAVQTNGGGSLNIRADGSQSGAGTVINGGTGHGVACFDSMLTITSVNGGTVLVRKAQDDGLHAQACLVRAETLGSTSRLITFNSNGSANGENVFVKNSQVTFKSVAITNSPGNSIYMPGGSLAMTGSASTGNATGPIPSNGASVILESWGGANTMADKATQYGCSRGGRIYVEPNAVSPLPAASTCVVTQ